MARRTAHSGDDKESRQTTETYDRVAADFAARSWEVVLERALDSFTGRLEVGGRVLDLGCGPGRDIALLRQRGFEVLGADLSMGMLREARHRVGGALVQSDMRALPLAGACLDGVWMCASLLHLPRSEAPGVLGEVGRVLRPGGVVYISVKEGEGEGWQESAWRRFFTYYRTDELARMVETAGFTVEDMWTKAGEKAVWISVLGRLG